MQSTEDLTIFVQNLLQQMQSRFSTMSDALPEATGDELQEQTVITWLDVSNSGCGSSDGSNKPELRFLPDVLAEAIDLGVMQALYEMQKRHATCVEIFNCNRLIKHELGKDRKVTVAEDAASFTIVQGST